MKAPGPAAPAGRCQEESRLEAGPGPCFQAFSPHGEARPRESLAAALRGTSYDSIPVCPSCTPALPRDTGSPAPAPAGDSGRTQGLSGSSVVQLRMEKSRDLPFPREAARAGCCFSFHPVSAAAWKFPTPAPGCNVFLMKQPGWQSPERNESPISGLHLSCNSTSLAFRTTK